MANHYYFVGRDMPTAELCLFRGGGYSCRAINEIPLYTSQIPPYTSQIERAEFVTKVQPTTKVFDYCMNKKFTDCYTGVGNG